VESTRTSAALSDAPQTMPSLADNSVATPQPLRGMRRSMARAMAQAHAQVVPTTLMEDANIQRWAEGEDLTARLIRALVQATRAEPTLNAWFDAQNQTLTVHNAVHVGVAIDTDEGLFVANLADAQAKTAAQIRQEVSRLRAATLARRLTPAELSGYTLMVSNFGVYAGRYATPVIAPPCVAILAAGRARIAAVPVLGAIAAQKILPLSLTFDHRACTGGEAARFLAALLQDLEKTS
jgi:2-oxoisovalerate dehydrogenase E2 component (dihydrolipoyl transacylase)